MKKSLLTLLFMAIMACGNVVAQEPIQIKDVIFGNQIEKIEMDSKNKEHLPQKNAPLRKFSKTQTPPILKDSPNYDDYEGETVRIYFDIIWDEEKYAPEAISIFNGVNSAFAYLFGIEEHGSPVKAYMDIPVEELPEGKYAAWVRFSRLEDWGFDAFVIGEVNLPSEEALEFDSYEIKYDIEFHPILPNGEQVKFDTIRWIDYAPWYETVSDDGNVTSAYGDTYFVHDDFEYTINSMFSYDNVTEDNPWPNFWRMGVNELSDKFKYFMTLNVETKEGENLHINMNSVGTSYIDVRNGTDFSSISFPEIKHSPIYDGIPEGEPVEGYNCFNIVCGDTSGFWNIFSNKPIQNILVWQSKDCAVNTLISAFSFAQFDYIDKYVESWEEDGEIFEWTEYYPYGIYSPILFPTNGVDEYVTTEVYKDSEDELGRIYPGHERFSYTSDEIGCEIGNTAPILYIFNRVLQPNEDVSYNLIRIDGCYGRLGESRNIDAFFTKKSVTFNGEVVCSDKDDFDTWLMEWNSTKHAAGSLDYTFVDENFEVDDISGRNITTLHTQWMSEDMTAPCLSMLMTRDANDVITDKFENKSGAILEVAAFDDNSGYAESGFKNILIGAKVEAEYSPFRVDEWEALDAEEIADLYSYTYGSFYRAHLDSIDRESENGWYDLRIKVTDAAGNTQQQVISPAFRIEDLRSSAYFITNSEEKETYYNLQGIEIAKPSTGIFIRKKGDKTEKIFINQE